MSQIPTSRELPPSPDRGELLRLIGLSGLLPAVVAAVNYLLAAPLADGGASSSLVTLQLAWYVAQVGIVGALVGRGLRSPLLRWIVFGWLLLLINLLTIAMTLGEFRDMPLHLPTAGLFAGQIGLGVVWGFLGDTRWPVRVPLAALAVGGLLALWFNQWINYRRELWDELLLFYLATLSALCALVRLTGFRLAIVDPQTGDSRPGGADFRLQFGIKHVLTWTTALAILLAIGRGMDLLRWEVAQEAMNQCKPWKIVMAAGSGMTIIVALWVALGTGRWWWRYPAGVLMVLLLGSLLSIWNNTRQLASIALANAGGWRQVDWELMEWYEIGWWWLAWMFLSGGLLAATLIILRVLGYRLVRLARQTTSVRPAAA
jgi:hypothetical protein